MPTNFAKKKADRPERPESVLDPVVALKKATGERSEEIEISRITIDQSLQVRSKGLDGPTVDKYRAVIQNGGELPPITLYRVQTDDAQSANIYLLAAGFHRIEAHKLEGRKTIFAVIRQGTREDAMIEAARSNLAHGLDLKVPDLRRALEILLVAGYYTRDDVLSSNKAIAADLGVTAETVSVWVKEIVTGRNLPVDLSKRWGKDGRVYEVENIQESNRERAAELAERRAAEEAERKRGLPALDKLRVITQYLINRYRDAQAKKKTPFFDDPGKGYKWCFQVSSPAIFVVDIDWEHQFIHEYGAKAVSLYREFLRLADQAIFTEADMDGWSDEELADWVTAMKQRPPRQPNATTETFHQTGMAQPKNPNIEIPQPKVLGRHRPETAATESEADPCPFAIGQRVHMRYGDPIVGTVKDVRRNPVGDWQAQVDFGHAIRWTFVDALELEEAVEPSLDDAPFYVGQNVEVFESGEKGVVQRVTYANYEWRINVLLYDGVHVFKADELQRIFAEVIEEAIEQTPTPVHDDPAPCPFKVGDRVILKRNPKPVNVVKAIKQFNGAWRLTMTTAEGYDFYEVPSNLDFAPAAVVVEEQAVMPFRTGDIVRDLQSGELVEVIGFSSDGVVTVEGDDQKGKSYQYDVWAYDLEKYDARADPPSKAAKANGRRQAEVMIEDARTIVPRLLVNTSDACADFRMTTLVQWEAPKSIETILQFGDVHEINLLKRDLERARAEWQMVIKGSSMGLDNVNAMLAQIKDWATVSE